MASRSRRRFLHGSLALAGLGLLSGCGILPPQTQQPPKIPRIGVVAASSSNSDLLAEPFRRGLAELGYVDGQNIVIEWRVDEGRGDRLAQNVAELVNLNLDLIVALGDNRTRVASDATGTIPIVMAHGVDPVGAGLIESFARPGGNVTGTIEGNPSVHGQRLQLLREIAPGITRVTTLGSVPSTSPARLRELEAAAQVLGLQFRVLSVPTAEALDDALARAAGERTDALYVVHSGLIAGQQARIFDFAERQRLPAMYGSRRYAEAGGLAAYGPNLQDIYYRSATYVDKILQGAKPAELPVELPTRFDFVVNLRTAQALGLTIPQSVLQQATEIVQ